MDTDGPRKLIRDSIEGVLHVNDRDTCDGPALFPIMDGRGKRVEVLVDLLSIVPADVARERETQADRRRVQNERRRTSRGSDSLPRSAAKDLAPHVRRLVVAALLRQDP